jgi:hypothetical protein
MQCGKLKKWSPVSFGDCFSSQASGTSSRKIPTLWTSDIILKVVRCEFERKAATTFALTGSSTIWTSDKLRLRDGSGLLI